jgi:hypothetical protein
VPVGLGVPTSLGWRGGRDRENEEEEMKRSMLRPYVIYVPEEIWMKFIREEVDHFEYDIAPGKSVAVYADGTREEFDSEVNDERVEQWERERREWYLKQPGAVLLYSGTLTVPKPKVHRQLKKVDG